MLAAVSRVGIAADDELLTELDLQFEPIVGAMARHVPRVDPFGDHTCPALVPRLVKHFLAAAFN